MLEQLVAPELMRAHPGLSPQRRLDRATSRGALVDALRTHLPQISSGCRAAGCRCGASCPEDVDATSVAGCRGCWLRFVAAGPRFAAVGGLDRRIRVPFVSWLPEVMVDAVARLAGALESARAPLRPAGWLPQQPPAGRKRETTAARRLTGPTAPPTTCPPRRRISLRR